MTSAAFSGLSCPSSTPCSDNATASGVTFTRQWWITTNSPVAGVNRIDVRVNWIGLREPDSDLYSVGPAIGRRETGESQKQQKSNQ